MWSIPIDGAHHADIHTTRFNTRALLIDTTRPPVFVSIEALACLVCYTIRAAEIHPQLTRSSQCDPVIL